MHVLMRADRAGADAFLEDNASSRRLRYASAADGTSERHEPESDDGSRLCWMAMAPSGHSTAPPSSLAAVSLIDSSLVLIGGFNRVADADLAQLHLCRLAGSAPGDQLAHGS